MKFNLSEKNCLPSDEPEVSNTLSCSGIGIEIPNHTTSTVQSSEEICVSNFPLNYEETFDEDLCDEIVENYTGEPCLNLSADKGTYLHSQ